MYSISGMHLSGHWTEYLKESLLTVSQIDDWGIPLTYL